MAKVSEIPLLNGRSDRATAGEGLLRVVVHISFQSGSLSRSSVLEAKRRLEDDSKSHCGVGQIVKRPLVVDRSEECTGKPAMSFRGTQDGRTEKDAVGRRTEAMFFIARALSVIGPGRQWITWLSAAESKLLATGSGLSTSASTMVERRQSSRAIYARTV